jgi:hypothetical protein
MCQLGCVFLWTTSALCARSTLSGRVVEDLHFLARFVFMAIRAEVLVVALMAGSAQMFRNNVIAVKAFADDAALLAGTCNHLCGDSVR